MCLFFLGYYEKNLSNPGFFSYRKYTLLINRDPCLY